MSGVRNVDIDAARRGGRPCIPGHRITLADVLGRIAYLDKDDPGANASLRHLAGGVWPHLSLEQVAAAVAVAWEFFDQEFDPATGLPRGGDHGDAHLA